MPHQGPEPIRGLSGVVFSAFSCLGWFTALLRASGGLIAAPEPCWPVMVCLSPCWCIAGGAEPQTPYLPCPQPPCDTQGIVQDILGLWAGP